MGLKRFFSKKLFKGIKKTFKRVVRSKIFKVAAVAAAIYFTAGAVMATPATTSATAAGSATASAAAPAASAASAASAATGTTLSTAPIAAGGGGAAAGAGAGGAAGASSAAASSFEALYAAGAGTVAPTAVATTGTFGAAGAWAAANPAWVLGGAQVLGSVLSGEPEDQYAAAEERKRENYRENVKGTGIKAKDYTATKATQKQRRNSIMGRVTNG